jgi:hypothetical protein
LAFSGAFGNFEVWDRAMRNEAEAWLQLAPLIQSFLATTIGHATHGT